MKTSETAEKLLAAKFIASCFIGGFIVGVSLFRLYSGGSSSSGREFPSRRRRRSKLVCIWTVVSIGCIMVIATPSVRLVLLVTNSSLVLSATPKLLPTKSSCKPSGGKITTFNISLVVHGTIAKSNDFQKENSNPYAAVPIQIGIFKTLESSFDIATSTIIRSIV